MSIKDSQIMFIKEASRLGDFQSISKTDLANGYCDAEEGAIAAKEKGDTYEAERLESIRSAYYAALMLRYWYKIYEWVSNSASLNLDPIDFIEWLSKSLWVAFYYRTWRYEYEATVKDGKFISWKLDANGNKILNHYYYKIDPSAPDRMINRCCGSIRGRFYQFLNKDKRKTNVQTYSLDKMTDETGDSALDYSGCIANDEPKQITGAYCLVAMLLKKNEFIEALITDGIANYDSYKAKVSKSIKKVNEEEQEIVSSEYTFDSRALVRHLTSINENFMTEFCKEYELSDTQGISIYQKLKTLSSSKLYKYIEKTLIEIRQSKNMLECVTA